MRRFRCCTRVSKMERIGAVSGKNEDMSYLCRLMGAIIDQILYTHMLLSYSVTCLCLGSLSASVESHNAIRRSSD